MRWASFVAVLGGVVFFGGAVGAQEDAAAAAPAEAAPVAPGAASGAEDARKTAEVAGPVVVPDEPKVSGFQVGVRAGYVRALDATAGNSLTYQTPALLPVILDVGYRTSTHVYLGVTGQLALAARNDCSGATGTCSAKEYRLGATFQYHFSPLQTFDPWFGAGFGYEVLHLSGYFGDPGGHVTRTGFVLLDAQLGGDFALRNGPRAPKLGPYVGLAMGAIGSESGVVYGNNRDRSPTHDHQWVAIGVRGTLDL